MVDYWPRRLDLAALKAGALAEVLNLAPWGGVLLQLPPHRAAGAHGWGALGASLGEHWLRDITTTQVGAQRLCGVKTDLWQRARDLKPTRVSHSRACCTPLCQMHWRAQTRCCWWWRLPRRTSS